MTFTCPRRAEGPKADELGADHWEVTDGYSACSYCGSLHPETALDLLASRARLTPTDKDYKAYIEVPAANLTGSWTGKLYFQHLSVEQQQRFVELNNERRINFGYPGHFYVLPFFCRHKRVHPAPWPQDDGA